MQCAVERFPYAVTLSAGTVSGRLGTPPCKRECGLRVQNFTGSQHCASLLWHAHWDCGQRRAYWVSLPPVCWWFVCRIEQFTAYIVSVFVFFDYPWYRFWAVVTTVRFSMRYVELADLHNCDSIRAFRAADAARWAAGVGVTPRQLHDLSTARRID